MILSLIGDKMREESHTNRGRPTSVGRQLLIALRFYAIGTFHDVTGQMAGFSKSHISVIITRVSHILSSIFKDLVKFPTLKKY